VAPIEHRESRTRAYSSDEGGPVTHKEARHPGKRLGKNLAVLGPSQTFGRQNERRDAGGLQCRKLRVTVSYAFVSSDDDPAFYSGAIEPDLIRRALGETVNVDLHDGAGVA
jgi:hypothetical protein